MNYLRRITVFLTFLFSILLIDATTHAKSGQTFEVNATFLNVRTGPSPDADIVGKLYKGNKVRKFQEESG